MNRAQRRSNWLASHRQTSRDSAQGLRSPAAVRLHIGELVFHGFPPTSRYSLAESTKVQLTTLLTEQGVPPDFKTNQAFVDAGSFQLTANSRPNAIGSLVARAIYGRTK